MNVPRDHLPRQFGVTPAAAEHHSGEGGRRTIPECQVVREDVLTIEVEDIGAYSLMWTPTDEPPGDVGYTAQDGVLADGDIPEALALAAGFAFTEGIIDSLSDIAAMWICHERPDVVNLRLTHPDEANVRRRNVVVNSSCGVCGGREQLFDGVTCTAPPVGNLRLRIADLATIRTAMQDRQRVFGATGGTHGATLFGPDLQLLAVAEDLGRHNALDKVIGRHLLAGRSFAGCGAFISSRVSYEMAAKAVRAGLQVLAAISAPSSLAIELAQRHGLTLCGFVRDDRAMVYAHPQRIID